MIARTRSLFSVIALAALATTSCDTSTSPIGPASGPGASLSGGTGGTGGGGTGGGGGTVSACQPLPGTCVLNAKLQSTSLGKVAPLTGQVRFERSSAGMRLTGSFNPGGLVCICYYALVLDTPAGSTVVGYAARGTFPAGSQTITLEPIGGDGLLSQTPNVNPVAQSWIDLLQRNGQRTNLFLTDAAPPSADVLALLLAVHAGSSVHLAVLDAPPDWDFISMYIPVARVWDMGSIGTLQ